MTIADHQAVAASAPVHPLIRKLELHGALPAADHDFLDDALSDVRTFASRRDIIRVGDEPEFVHLMIEGWACRYALTREGGRQITAFLMPGDFCDAHVTMLGRMDHSIGALGKARVAFIARDTMAMIATRPALTRALWWASLVDEGVLRAWIVNMGRRNARDRVAHLICELHARSLAVGLVRTDRFELPLTQEDLGDALGLTSVHVNRVLRVLRERALMTFANQTIVVPDINALRKVAGFKADYLHLIDAARRPSDA